MQRVEKEQVVAELHERFVNIQGAVLTNYHSLSVRSITEIRRAFREENIFFEVVKNTLARLAAKDTPIEVLVKDFVGPIAIAYSNEDPVAPARVASESAKKEDKFEITCGYVDNTRLGVEGVASLAKLPGKDTLRAQLLSLFNAPATNLVRVCNGVPQKMALVLSAYEDKLKEENAEA